MRSRCCTGGSPQHRLLRHRPLNTRGSRAHRVKRVRPRQHPRDQWNRPTMIRVDYPRHSPLLVMIAAPARTSAIARECLEEFDTLSPDCRLICPKLFLAQFPGLHRHAASGTPIFPGRDEPGDASCSAGRESIPAPATFFPHNTPRAPSGGGGHARVRICSRRSCRSVARTVSKTCLCWRARHVFVHVRGNPPQRRALQVPLLTWGHRRYCCAGQ